MKQLAEGAAARLRLRVEPDYHGLDAHRSHVLASNGVTLVLDVGANVGQYARRIRKSGYRHHIISFEPQPNAFVQLGAAAAHDPEWEVLPFALGEMDGRAAFNITADSQSSSLLRPRSQATELQIVIDVRRLDDLALVENGKPFLLKLDVQGGELGVLHGAEASLRFAAAVECELSLTPLYENQPLIEDVIGALRGYGFEPRCLVRGYTDPVSHAVVQVDGIFCRAGSG